MMPKKMVSGMDLAIGYKGPMNIKQHARNLKFRGVGNATVLWNKVMKEVGLCRYAGPYRNIPFENYIQSPIGLVPKDNGKDTRLIFHLSYPRGGKTSVNFNTPKEDCSVNYPEFDRAIQMCYKLGVACKLAKSDMSSAFRHLGIKPEHWPLLLMMAVSPIDKLVYYFHLQVPAIWEPQSVALIFKNFQTLSHIW